MTTYKEIIDDLRNATGAEDSDIEENAMLGLCRLAIRFTIGAGALIDIDEANITLLAATYSYSVPAGFAYVQYLAYEDDTESVSTYDEGVPRLHYSFGTASGTPKVYFNRSVFDLRTGKDVRFFGQGRPSIPTALTDTVDPELEGVVQEVLEARFLSRLSQAGFQQGGVGIDRANQRRELKVAVDNALSHVDFRVRPGSTRIRGR